MPFGLILPILLVAGGGVLVWSWWRSRRERGRDAEERDRRLGGLARDANALLIETDEPADALAARLVARGIDARADGRIVVADLASGDGGEFGIYDAVRDETVALGLGLVRLEHRRHQLEDLFRSGGTDERVA